MEHNNIHKYLDTWPISSTCVYMLELASARVLLASYCQPDDGTGDYSSESEDPIFLHIYSSSIQCLLNTCSHR